MKKSTLIWVIVFVVALGVALYENTRPAPTSGYVINAEGNPAPLDDPATAPDFAVQDVNGNSVRFTDHVGKYPTVINIWATWCPPCRSELPHFEEMYKKYGNKISFMMIDVSGGAAEDPAEVKKFLAENGYTFPVYFDTNGEVSKAYDVNAIPVSVFIDKNGTVIDKQVGSMDANTLQAYLNKLLKQ